MQCTEVRFASFLSGVFTTNKSTGKETGKTHLCAVYMMFIVPSRQIDDSGLKTEYIHTQEYMMFKVPYNFSQSVTEEKALLKTLRCLI